MERLPAPPLPSWLERMFPYERYRVSVDGVAMHVAESGDPGGLPVLLLHGNPTWGFLWRKVIEALRGEKLRLIAPDLVGLGLSDKPRDARVHSLENHARWLGGLVDALGLRRLVLVAQDWGGPIGTRMLADRPQACAGLVLANTSVRPPREGSRSTAFHRFARLPLVSDLAFRGLGVPQVILDRAQGDRGSIEGEVARAYRWPLRRIADRAAPLALARMVPDGPLHPSVPGLRRCEAFVRDFVGPAALVWGERDPILGRALRRVHELLPDAEVTRTRAGHFLQEEVPDAIAAAVRHVAHAG